MLADNVFNSGEHKIVFAAGVKVNGIYFIQFTAAKTGLLSSYHNLHHVNNVHKLLERAIT